MLEQVPINPADLRQNYFAGALDENDVLADPIAQFARWFGEAQRAAVLEPNAMTLATADGTGKPSARVVLLKDFDDRGFVFYTSYISQKGIELAQNPRASLVFWWPALERQVRIDGSVEQISPEETQAYFRSRPRPSQIGAWASHQSRVTPSRQPMENRQIELERRFADQPVPVPKFWGGFRVVPSCIEFWQGRPNRLHDRLQFTRIGEGWTRHRLEP